MAQLTKITVTATTHVPLAKVWKAWNTPSDIIQWNSPDPSWHTPSSENDLRVGGKFKKAAILNNFVKYVESTN